MLASARQAVDAVFRLAQEKTPFGSATLLRERASTQAKLAQAEAALRSARALLYESISQVWEAVLAGESPSLTQRADLLLAAANATSSAAQAVELAYSVAGISGIYTRTSLERHFRDVEVLKQHAFTYNLYCPATRLRGRRAKHGQVVCAVLVLAVCPAH